MSEPDFKSPRPSMPLWLILLTLLGGAFLVQRGRYSAEEKEATSPEASGEPAAGEVSTREDRMLGPLREFLGLPLLPKKAPDRKPLANLPVENQQPEGTSEPASTIVGGGASNSQNDPNREALAAQIKEKVGLLEFLIVSVADPIDTATNYRFDLQLDTLHKALGADDYVPDYYYLPWRPPEKDKKSVHRTEPAVLLYRRNGRSLSTCPKPMECCDLLLVYLVGETPTSGIHKEAFLEAVRQIRTLGKMAPYRKPCSQPPIGIAGPLFTGGADSLALAIRQAREDKLTDAKFEVITGTAVSIDRTRFEALAGTGNAELHSTVLSGNVLRAALIDHVLARNWWKKVRIAWLTETGTGFGSSISIKERGRIDIEKQNEREEKKQMQTGQAPSLSPPSRSQAAQTGKGEKEGLAKYEIIEFRFPINISKVRVGYVESRRRERSGQASLGPEGTRLPIPFDDISTARDVPPMQTPKVTAPTSELILRQILTRIRNERIKYVGISSSDPRDAIFLAELIQEQCPDAQIMLVHSDVLYLHSEYRSIMHGTLVCSTYPLHPEALDLCFPFGESKDGKSRSVVLSSQPNYGLYNSVLFLRGLERGQYTNGEVAGHRQLTLSYSKAAGWPAFPLGYSLPFDESISEKPLRPPVWISRIGSTGICPISVRVTDDDDYTVNLKLAAPSDDLPSLESHSRIPDSLFIASLTWSIIAAIYCAAILFPKPFGNWAKALAAGAGQPRQFQPLIYVFRALITCAFLSVLVLFAKLLGVYFDWVGRKNDDYLPWFQSWICSSVVIILLFCLMADWGRAFWGLVVDLRGALAQSFAYWQRRHAARRRAVRGRASDLFSTLKRLITSLRSVPAPVSTAAAAQAMGTDLNWHLIAARGIGLTLILTLVVIFVSQGIGQEVAWNEHPDSFLWFMRNSDMWNGLSPALTAQFLAVALIILAHGMLLQMHLLSPDYTIIKPQPSTSAPPSENDRRKGSEEVRNALLFPLLSRWQRNRPVVLDILCLAAMFLWLAYLGWHLQSPDHFTLPLVNFPAARLLFVAGFWCVRLFKLIQILNGLSRHLEELTRDLRERWPDDWPKIFELLAEKPVGLQELFWTSRPTVNDRELSKAKQALLELQSNEAGRLKAERKLAALEIDLYVRQFFHHIVRLGLGLVAAACLLFLSAHAFPFSKEPLVRLSASVMLATIGCVVAWYYLKFDRNELLSHLVGTDPKHVSVNWSLVQMVAPALLLMAVALVSQTFPEIWQWMRNVVEPMTHSSS